MIYPEDLICIARGQHATALKERREQIKRVREICEFMQGQVAIVIQGVQKSPPEEITGQIQQMNKCLENIFKAQVKIIELSGELDRLEEPAWGKKAT